MAKNQGVHAVVCPNCGGNVDLAPNQNQVTCKFCGTLIEREQSIEPLPRIEPPPPVVSRPIAQRSVPVPVQKTGGCSAVGFVVGLLMLIGVGIFVFASVQNGGQSLF